MPILYETQDEQQFTERLRADSKAREDARREVEAKIQNGCRQITRSDFDRLNPDDKIRFHRIGGKVEGMDC